MGEQQEEACMKHAPEGGMEALKCCFGFFPWFREYNLQRKQSMQLGSTEKEEMKQQQRMKAMRDMIRKIKAKGRLGAKNSWWVSELLAAECEKACLHSGLEDIMHKSYDS